MTAVPHDDAPAFTEAQLLATVVPPQYVVHPLPGAWWTAMLKEADAIADADGRARFTLLAPLVAGMVSFDGLSVPEDARWRRAWLGLWPATALAAARRAIVEASARSIEP